MHFSYCLVVAALSSIVEAIKFVLDCSELPVGELKYIQTDGEMEEDSV
jgi:hypothetical protein